MRRNMNLPSREEFEGWDHTQVAFFFSAVSTRKIADKILSRCFVCSLMFELLRSGGGDVYSLHV